VITLKEALTLSQDELSKLKDELSTKINANKNIGAYVEQFTNEDINYANNSGVPIAIKANINVLDQETTSCSNICTNTYFKYTILFDIIIFTKYSTTSFTTTYSTITSSK